MKISDLPFHIGPMPTSGNPEGLPSKIDFHLVRDHPFLIQQCGNQNLGKHLDLVYGIGFEFGTPLTSSSVARPYVEEFMEWVCMNSEKHENALEIGAGMGFLTYFLKNMGWEIVGIEPGKRFKESWKSLGIDVVNDFFPSRSISHKFSTILSYGVLEHVQHPDELLRNMVDHLDQDGKIIIGVPDCTEEIQLGDPAMLAHEHFSYFTKWSLGQLFDSVGLNYRVQKSSFGRNLFAVATVNGDKKHLNHESENDLQAFNTYVSADNYFSEMNKNVKKVQDFIEQRINHGTLGIYIPVRFLNYMKDEYPVRFFDDDPNLHNKYFPPFAIQIESLADLILNPVDNVLIASRTFEDKVFSKLISAGYKGEITKISNLYHSNFKEEE